MPLTHDRPRSSPASRDCKAALTLGPVGGEVGADFIVTLARLREVLRCEATKPWISLAASDKLDMAGQRITPTVHKFVSSVCDIVRERYA